MSVRANPDGTFTPDRYVNPVAMFALSVSTLAYGAGYLLSDIIDFNGENIQLIRVFGSLPFVVYGIVWVMIGAAGIIGMFSRRVFRVAFSAMSALFLTWSAIHLTSFVLTGAPAFGSLLSAAVWGALSASTFALTTVEMTDARVGDRIDAIADEHVADVLKHNIKK